MLGANASHLELIGHLLQAALEVLAALHKVLDIVHVGEEELEAFKELTLRLGQVSRCEQVQEVAKIVPAMKGEPPEGEGRL